MKCRVSLQQRSGAKDSTGQEVIDWTEIRKQWSNINFVTGREYTDPASAKISQISAVITVGWCTDILATMRIVYEGQIFNILAVRPDLTKRDVVYLDCNTGVSNG